MNYILARFEGDANRMESALHPKLAKKIVIQRQEERGEISQVIQTSALVLVQQTRRGGGSNIAKDERETRVSILGITGNAVSVQVDAGLWVDYMHLLKWNGEWKIIYVLWEQTG